MNVMHALALRLQDAGEGSSSSGFWDSIPTDPASLVVLILVVGAVGFVIYAGRSGGGPKDP